MHSRNFVWIKGRTDPPFPGGILKRMKSEYLRNLTAIARLLKLKVVLMLFHVMKVFWLDLSAPWNWPSKRHNRIKLFSVLQF